MLPFSVSLRPGEPLFEQVVYAVTRAVVTGQLRAGDPFPSVRTLSQALRINPNTSHKIVAALIDQGLLEVRPGVGTVVGRLRHSGTAARRLLLNEQAEKLVVEARRAGLSLPDLMASIRAHWARTMSRVS
jgi:GntR family transcriptional regulator